MSVIEEIQKVTEALAESFGCDAPNQAQIGMVIQALYALAHDPNKEAVC